MCVRSFENGNYFHFWFLKAFSSWLGATAHCLCRVSFCRVIQWPGVPTKASAAPVNAKISLQACAIPLVEGPLRVVGPISLDSVILGHSAASGERWVELECVAGRIWSVAVFGCEISSASATVLSARALRTKYLDPSATSLSARAFLRTIRVDLHVIAPVGFYGWSLGVPRCLALSTALRASTINESGCSSSPD